MAFFSLQEVVKRKEKAIFRSRRRDVQKKKLTYKTYTGRDIQRYSRVEQYEEIRLDTRQKLQRRHHLRFTETRYKR